MQKEIRWLSVTSFFEGIAAIIWLSSIPAEGSFFSPARIGLLLAILAISIGWLFLYRLKAPLFQFEEFLLNWRSRDFLASLCICIPLLILSGVAQQDIWSTLISDAAFTRLLPVIVWGSVITAQVGLFLLFAKGAGVFWDTLASFGKPTAMLLAGFLLTWAFVSATKIGITTDAVGLSWGPPGTPIIFGQVVLAFAISLCTMMALWLVYRKRQQPVVLLDAVFFIGLWALAALLWSKEPMGSSHFAPLPMPPNFEVYPNSDAAIFDRSAYQLVFGAGFKTQLMRRPLFVGLLALFHAIVGPNYDATVFLQILILASIPALVFLLTARISNRLAGLLAGGLIVLREENAIRLSGEIATAHAKLLMSDLATMLGIAAILYLAIIMIKRREQNPWWFAVLGGCVGLTMLVRAQALIILFPILVFFILSQRPLKRGLYQSLIVLFGVIVVLLPWIWRNWNLTGTLLLGDRGEQRLMARNYSADPTSSPFQQSNETDKEFAARLNREILGYASSHPGEVLFFISNHLFHNLIDSAVYIAPIYSTDSPKGLLGRLPYWGEWEGDFTLSSGVPIFINLTLLALGIVITQKRQTWGGMLPLAVFLFYIGGNAVARSAGWRFILPVDWIVLMYFTIGLAAIPSGIRLVLQNKGEQHSKSIPPRSAWIPFLFAMLFLAGASVPIAERLVPDRNYQGSTDAAIGLLAQERTLSHTEVDTFLQQENAVMVSGVALYPRYFARNARLELAGMPVDYTYLHFWLIGEANGQVVLALKNAPNEFPNMATVTILGCKSKNYISAWGVINHSVPTQVLLRDPRTSLNCPLGEPN